MTNTIVDLLYKNNHINKDEIEAYKFCIDFIIEYITFIMISLTLGSLFSLLIPVALFMLVFLLLRSYGGGVHARTHIRCTIYSYLLIILFIVICLFLLPKWNNIYNYCIISLYILSFFTYVLFAPVIPCNKQITSEEHTVFRFKCIITDIIICVVFTICMLSGSHRLCTAICFGSSLASFSLIAAKRKESGHES